MKWKKQERGSTDCIVSNDGTVATKWYDNKPVTVASNFVGFGKVDTFRRWHKNSKNYINIHRPESIAFYNGVKGSVDKLDFLLILNRSGRKNRRWTVRMIFSVVNNGLVNS